MVKKTIILVCVVFCAFLNTGPINTQADVEFTQKQVRELELMEARHFRNPISDENNSYRLDRLERELFNRTYEEQSVKERIDRLKIASQKKGLSGAAVPLGLDRQFTLKRLNNEVMVEEDDEVGIIDGLLRLYNPDAYKFLRSKRSFEDKYGDLISP